MTQTTASTRSWLDTAADSWRWAGRPFFAELDAKSAATDIPEEMQP